VPLIPGASRKNPIFLQKGKKKKECYSGEHYIQEQWSGECFEMLVFYLCAMIGGGIGGCC